jgi:L,D-transpeptidase catalytic domain
MSGMEDGVANRFVRPARRMREWFRTGRRNRGIAATVLAAALVLTIALSIQAYRVPYKIVARERFRQQEGSRDRAEMALVEKLNRADRVHLPGLAKVLVPKRRDQDELSFSPLPLKYPSAKGNPKLLVVYQPEQVFGAYEFGQLVRWGPVSTGRPDRPTPDGLFFLTWRSHRRRSSLTGEELRWYFNFEQRRGLAFHEHELPGEPASDGCVRLLERDAAWLYRWGEPGRGARKKGTPIWIVGQYHFGMAPPWQSAVRKRTIRLPAIRLPADASLAERAGRSSP